MSATIHTPLSEDAALVATLVSTAIPFSHCAEDEAERWLRALRLHGQVGAALQGLGVGEAPLETEADALCDEPSTTPPLGKAAIDRALGEAARAAAGRGATTIGTADLMCGLLDVYGELLDRSLEARGATRAEVLERLGELEEHPERT
ncbi:MAG: hypothetical protein WD399_06715 [Thermoleophilaceae bacterium]